MSWFARSLVNSLVGDYDDEEEEEEEEMSSGSQQHVQSLIGSPASGGDEPGSASRSVKEDLSELTKTLTRQFWGVASFLAPPPQSFEPPTSSSSQMSRRGLQPADLDPSVVGGSDDPTVAVESPRLAGIRSDFAEISGKVRSGISMLSHTKAVTEISKIASSFLPFGLEDAHDKDDIEEEEEPEGRLEEVDAVGVTEEVLMFARNISMHPETWLDFPLLRDKEDSDDFNMSDAQSEHASAIERLAPRLAALRVELCPSHMTEGCFWKVYFVLLHPRLNKNDAELLSTPQIVEARTMLLQDLQSRKRPVSESSGREVSNLKEHATAAPIEGCLVSTSNAISEVASSRIPPSIGRSSDPISDVETEKHPVQTIEVKIVDKSVIEEEMPKQGESKDLSSEPSKISVEQYEAEVDDWLEDETGEAGSIRNTPISLLQEEDLSFSDLDDDDDDQSMMKNSKIVVHLNKQVVKGDKSSSPENKESNDWLNVEDIDME